MRKEGVDHPEGEGLARRQEFRACEHDNVHFIVAFASPCDVVNSIFQPTRWFIKIAVDSVCSVSLRDISL